MQLALLQDTPVRPPGGTLPLGGRLNTHGKDVSYREIPCQQVLGSSPAARRMGMPFSWTINPYRGCEIGCGYCYARDTHSYLGQESVDFEHEIFVKLGAERSVVRAMRPGHFAGEAIAIGSATDPYQPAERRYRVTRKVLERLAAFSGLELSITTKSPLIVDDADLLARIGKRSTLSVNISLISLNGDLVRRFEPKGATPEKRLETISELASRGIRVNLFIMPVMPDINDDPAELGRLERAARAVGATSVVRGKFNLRAGAWPVFSAMLKEHYPHLLPDYRKKAQAAGLEAPTGPE
ncbi:MAG: radical SAM protein [Leptospirillia bacterium]